MAGDIGNEFSGLPMGDLIGAPLTAACEAQIRLAKATSDFITTVGLEGGKPRQVDFKFWRPIGGVPPAKEGEVVARSAMVEEVAISVPFLAIVNVPALSVKSLDIVFDMEVKTSETSKDSTTMGLEAGVNASVGWGPVKADISIKGSVSTHKENTRSTDKSAKYHVELHARDDGMPEGLQRVLDILRSAIVPHTIGAPTAVSAARSLELPASVVVKPMR